MAWESGETKRQKRELAHQTEMAETQHGYDVDMFNRESSFNAQQAQQQRDWEKNMYDYTFSKESAYNSPAAQVQRFKAAGINPALAVGQLSDGSVSPSGLSGSSASASGSNTVDMAGYANALTNRQNSTIAALSSVAGIAQEMASYASQRDLNKSQEVKNYADAAKTSGVDTDVARETVRNISQSTKTSSAQERNIDADTSLKREQVRNVSEDTRRLATMIDKYLPQQMKESEKRIEDLASQIWQRQQVTPAEVAQIRQEIAESISRLNLNDAQRSMIEKELSWYDAKASMDMAISYEQFQQLSSNNQVLKLQNDISSQVLSTKNVNGLWNDAEFRNNIYKLRALQYLTPFPGSSFLSEGLHDVESLGRTFNLFNDKGKGSSIRGFLR